MGTSFRCAVTSGIVRVDKRGYDWSMRFKATINQSKITFVLPNDPKNGCTESLYSLPLWFLEWGIAKPLVYGGSG